jgi:hypothetical protein
MTLAEIGGYALSLFAVVGGVVGLIVFVAMLIHKGW